MLRTYSCSEIALGRARPDNRFRWRVAFVLVVRDFCLRMESLEGDKCYHTESVCRVAEKKDFAS